MLFCQHKFNTWNKLGKDWLNIYDTPHYKHLLGGDDYYNYLKLSWRGKQDKLHDKIQKFENLLIDIRKNGIKEPIEIITRMNGDEMVFHGNHRYAIARYLDIEFKVKEISIDEYINFNIYNKKSRFGTNDNGTPYQSLFYKGKCLIEGRRKDQIDRNDLILKEDLIGKRVYDFGCNIGSSSILAHESGAIVEGWDFPEFRTTAIRLALLMNYDIKYKSASGEYDTLFLFSVHAHADIPDIKSKVIYIETHEDGILPDRFKKSEKMGQLGKRTLWRFENNQ